MKDQKLDPRLLVAANYVDKGAIFADIGCDHGYLSIYLMRHREALKGYACDISEASLSKAKKNLLNAGLENKVETILTDGLNSLENLDLDHVVIAGMGGEIISGIINLSPFLMNENIKIILQPMSKEATLRRYLYKNGYEIYDETAVHSKKHDYTVMLVKFSGIYKEIDGLFANIGLLPKCRNKVSAEKMNRTAKYLTECALGLLRREETYQDGITMKETANQIREIVNELRLSIA